MITLYCTTGCPRCDSLREALGDLTIAHRVVEVRSAGDLPDEAGEVSELPVLIDEDGVFAGAAAVADHLQELESLRDEWYKFQSDACYCGERGDIE